MKTLIYDNKKDFKSLEEIRSKILKFTKKDIGLYRTFPDAAVQMIIKKDRIIAELYNLSTEKSTFGFKNSDVKFLPCSGKAAKAKIIEYLEGYLERNITSFNNLPERS